SLVGEAAGRFDDDLGADLLPRYLCRVFFSKDTKLVVVHRYRRLGARHLVREIAEDRVILQEVSKRVRVGQIIYGNEVKFLVSQCGSQNIAPDATEPIDPNFNRHCTPSQNREE